jgi:Ca2+-binding EF-hand superfamily protein
MILSAALLILAQTAAQGAAPAAKATPAAPPTKAAVEAQAKSTFERLDANKDGKVDRTEADKALASARATQDERRKQSIANAFARLDTNKDGQISRQEFEVANTPKAAPASQNAWFDANDIDKNGKVELNEAIAKAQRNFEALDKDNNGVLSAQELQASRRRAPSARN